MTTTMPWDFELMVRPGDPDKVIARGNLVVGFRSEIIRGVAGAKRVWGICHWGRNDCFEPAYETELTQLRRLEWREFEPADAEEVAPLCAAWVGDILGPGYVVEAKMAEA